MYEMAFELYGNYLNNEKIKELLPIRRFRFVEDLSGEVLKAQPELKTKSGIDEEQLKNYSGYTVLFADNTAEILIEKNGSMDNFFWCGTLIHEITHVRDFADYINILHYNSFDEMLKCSYFWYWTEFHAKYKGYIYMLNFVDKLSDKYKNPYVEDTLQRIYNFNNTVQQQINCYQKIYITVHMIGEILAYEQSSIVMPDNFYKCIIEEFEWFEGVKDFLEKHTETITIEEMLILSRNLKINLNKYQEVYYA